MIYELSGLPLSLITPSLYHHSFSSPPQSSPFPQLLVHHPRFRLHIIIILPFAVEVVARHAVDNVAVDPPSQKLQRARHEVRQFKHLVIINQQRGVRRQNGGRQQTDVAHIGVTKHGQELCSLIVQPCGVQNPGYLPQVACREQVGFRIQLC